MTRTAITRSLLTHTRRHVGRAVGAALSLSFSGLLLSGELAWGARGEQSFQQGSHHPAPVVRQPAPSGQRNLGNQTAGFTPHSGQNQEHLQQWMQSRSNLTLDQQQRALDNEPGFRQLSPEVQQRMHQRLAQLNSMTPEQRQRAYARTEAMERLAPYQRQQVRNALTSLGSLPKDRRTFVAREFRALRDLPPAQRQAFLNSPAMRDQFSDQERQTLLGLFEVAPYLPPPPQPPAVVMPPR